MLMVFSSGIVLGQPTQPPDTPENRAGVVVRFGDGTSTTACVAFAEAQISGIELLERSGLAVEIATEGDVGGFVCQIEQDGCPANECLCAFPPDYWRYWLLNNNTWQFSPVGASSRQVRNGSVDGWGWSNGGNNADTRPPAITFADICPTEEEPPARIYLPLLMTEASRGQNRI